MPPDPQPDRLAWNDINPHVSWALGPGRSYCFVPGQQESGKELMPLLLRLKGETANAFLDGDLLVDRSRLESWRDSFWLLCRHPESGGNGESAVWVAALAPQEILVEMTSSQARGAIESASLGRPLGTQALDFLKKLPRDLSGWLTSNKPAPMAAAANPPAVVMGIIDDGIAFLHERFCKAGNKTRIKRGWLMDPGLVLTEAGINALLASGRDESFLYRQSGAMDFVTNGHKPIAWRVAHGTHVMDLACGFDPAENEDRRPILFVQLPSKVTAAQAPLSLAVDIAFGIVWMVFHSLAIAAERGVTALPVVINISYGLLASWQSGLDGLAMFFEHFRTFCHDILGVELRVVLPAGNSFLSRLHAQTSFTAAGQKQPLMWRIPPDDRTPSILEVWLPAALPATSRLTLTITSPTKDVVTIQEHGAPVVLVGPSGSMYAEATWLKVPLSSRAVFTIIVQPTAHPDPNLPLAQLAPAGIWTVELAFTGNLAPDQLVHAWVRRDDRIYGYPPRGRQSHLEDDKYVRLDHAGRDREIDDAGSLVKREYTLNSMATGETPIVIGGYLGKEKVAARYSAAGAEVTIVPPPPAPPPPPQDRKPMRWPDAMAVSEDSRVHRGVLAAGSRSGSVVAMGGTSVSAPQIARIIADDLGNGGAGDHAWVQSQAEIAMPASPGKPPEHRGGAGRILTTAIVKVKRFD